MCRILVPEHLEYHIGRLGAGQVVDVQDLSVAQLIDPPIPLRQHHPIDSGF